MTIDDIGVNASLASYLQSKGVSYTVANSFSKLFKDSEFKPYRDGGDFRFESCYPHLTIPRLKGIEREVGLLWKCSTQPPYRGCPYITDSFFLWIVTPRPGIDRSLMGRLIELKTGFS